MNAQRGGFWALTCPVCGRPVDAPPAAPCPQCGLPAAGQAALVVARIGTTLTEIARDRDELLATLRASAPYAVVSAGSRPTAAPPSQPTTAPPPPMPPPTPPPPLPPAGGPARRRRPRLSPQQVLLGLGALLVVAAAIAFVAVAWTRLGPAFQAAVMLVVTAAACATSAWTARRHLRATEEALAAAGAALMVVDLGGARALGLLSLEDVSLRLYAASSCAIVLALTLGLARLTRTTATWPLAALLAAQPLPLLLLAPDDLSGPAGVGTLLVLAAVDLLVAVRLRGGLRPVARSLAGLAAAGGVAGGLLLATAADPTESWTATGLLLLAGGAATLLARTPRPALLPYPVWVARIAAGVGALALNGSLDTVGAPGPVIATAVGLTLLTAAVLVAGRRQPTAALVAGGYVLAVGGIGHLLGDHRPAPLALLFLAATVPAALAAVRLPVLRSRATGAAFVAPAAAILMAREAAWVAVPVAGLLFALLAAAAFAVATLRAHQPEEVVAAAIGALMGLFAFANTSSVDAWGQVGLQLAIAGAAAGGYALVASRRWVGVIAVADLVVAAWIAIGGAGVDTPEAYTLPAAAGLLVVALPRLRSGARSWAAEGPALAVALVPSAFVVVASPTALRLVLVVAAAAALTVLGTLTHRQAPFVLGAGVLAAVGIGRLAPYAPLLPRWLTLGAAGLLLLILGATYERRRQQAREAVAWVGQMN